MLTLFSTPKPFLGHSAVIQRNALASWKRLHPDVEIILFGDEEGTADIAREFGLRHEPHVERNEFGTKRIDFIFRKAQDIARHDFLCYVNCDIVLLSDFVRAFGRVRSLHNKFLMIGRRWDTDISDPLDFSASAWEQQLASFVRVKGVQQPAYSVDYFAFPRGLYVQMPPLVIGRIWWDHWLVWKAGREGVAIVDASSQILAVHQNHDYGYHPAGAVGVRNDVQSKRNYDLAGGKWLLHTIDDATHILGAQGERRNAKRFFAPYWRVIWPVWIPIWHRILDVTRPVRRIIGLRSKANKALEKDRILGA